MSSIFGRAYKTASTSTHTLVIYHNVEWEEWVAVVRAHPLPGLNTKPVIVSTHHTDSLEDAEYTGGTELIRASEQNLRTPLDPNLY